MGLVLRTKALILLDMGRPSTDLMLKGFLEYCIYDLRRNLWLLRDVFGDAIDDPLTKVEHGEKEWRNAHDWYVNNEIKVVLHLRKDRPVFPCISIALSNATEQTNNATLGDTHAYALGDIDPTTFNVNPDKIYDHFTPTAYDPTTGKITMPDDLNTDQLAPVYHMVVENNTGRSFVVKKIIDDKNFLIAPDQTLNLKDIYVLPVDASWVVERERSRFQESFEVGVHANSDPVEAIWLSQLVEYCLLKYKAKYLDQRNLQLSTFNIGNTSRNENYTGDNIYSRFFNLTFQVEADWISTVSPKLVKLNGGIIIVDGPKSPEELSEEIKKALWKMEGDK